MYSYRYASDDKWIYTGLDPSHPRLQSEEGRVVIPSDNQSNPFFVLKSLVDKALKSKKGLFGFGQKQSCPYNQFLDTHFEKKESLEEGLDLSDYHLEDGDLAILAIPNNGSTIPCQICSDDKGLWAEAAEKINDRCFVLSENGKIATVSHDPNNTDRIKILPSISFLSWAKPISETKPRFVVQFDFGTIKISDSKRKRDYFTMPQTENRDEELSAISRLLNDFGLASIVGRYPIRRKPSEDYGS